MERKTGFGPATPTLARLCSTPELLPHLLPLLMVAGPRIEPVSYTHLAGICNKGGNILGLMPHPERSTVAHLNGGTDGGDFWRSIAQDFAKREAL